MSFLLLLISTIWAFWVFLEVGLNNIPVSLPLQSKISLPPKPYAFVDLPIQSSLSLKNIFQSFFTKERFFSGLFTFLLSQLLIPLFLSLLGKTLVIFGI